MKVRIIADQLDELVETKITKAVNDIMGEFKQLPLGLTFSEKTPRYSGLDNNGNTSTSLMLEYSIGINTIADLDEATIIKVLVEVLWLIPIDL